MKRTGTLGALIAAALLVSACSSTTVFSLDVGECFDTPEGTEITKVPIVDCDDPHDSEVYWVFDSPDGERPEVSTLIDQCLAEFEAFVGVPYGNSALEFDAFFPSDTSWSEAGDRETICYVYVPDEKTTGTLGGSNR